MKIQIQGKGPLTLNQTDFLCEGGEGRIFVHGNCAYKIYLDPKKMIPLGKIQDLSVLSNQFIIKPEDILLDSKNNSIGYSMRLVKDTYALCQLFTKTFRNKHNLSHEMMLKLVRKLQDIVVDTHKHNILIVDLNELNFLVSQNLQDIFAIDVDSWQTKHFPATALMESVRDRHSKVFNEGTDWFAFAITSFQMFCNIHPYKGKTKTLMSLDERMMKNISVLHSSVSVPPACYDFAVIPDVYRQWYQAVLNEGKRIPPPDQLVAHVNLIQTVKNVVGTNNFDIQELETLSDQVINFRYHLGHKAFLTSNQFLRLDRDILPSISSKSKLIFSPKTNFLIVGSIENNKLKLFNASKRQEIVCDLAAQALTCYQDRFYIKNSDKILEIKLIETGNQTLVASKIVAQVSEYSSQLYDGIAIQNLLGSVFVSLFLSADQSYQVRLPELDNYKILDAKFDSGVLILLGLNIKESNKQNDKIYDHIQFRFDSIPTSGYDCKIIANIPYQEPNFTVLDSGVCVKIFENEKNEVCLELFSSKINSASVKNIFDPVLSTDIKLFKNGNKLLFAQDNKVYSITMKA